MASDSAEPGTFLMINIAAQRARQLMQGAAPLVRTNSRKPAAIAIREVERGMLPYYRSEEQGPLADLEVEEVADEEEA